jgi:hypothetical protein
MVEVVVDAVSALGWVTVIVTGVLALSHPVVGLTTDTWKVVVVPTVAV